MLCATKEKYISQKKKTKTKTIFDTVYMKGQHNVDNYDTLNPIKTKNH